MTYPFGSLGNPWTNAYIDENDMHTRIDVPLNAIANLMSLWSQGIGWSRFRAYDMVAPAGVGANIDFNTFGLGTTSWDSTNKRYTILTAGLYMVQAAAKQSTANAFRLKLLGLPAPFTLPLLSGIAAAVAGSGTEVSCLARFAGGEQVSVQAQNAVFTPVGADGTITTRRQYSWLSIQQIGF